MNPEELDDAIRSALPPPPKARGQWVEPAVASDEAVASLKRTLVRIFENCPDDASVADLRELLA